MFTRCGPPNRLHPLEQRVVAMVVGFEVRSHQQIQARGAVDEALAAAGRTLQLAHEAVQPIEIRLEIAAVPDREREQREEVEEVVVHENRERDGVGIVRAAAVHEVVHDVDGDAVLVHAIRFAVPVVDQVEAERARLLVVGVDEAVQPHGTRPGRPRMGAHAVTKPMQRPGERTRAGDTGENRGPPGQRRFDLRARGVEAGRRRGRLACGGGMSAELSLSRDRSPARGGRALNAKRSVFAGLVERADADAPGDDRAVRRRQHRRRAVVEVDAMLPVATRRSSRRRCHAWSVRRAVDVGSSSRRRSASWTTKMPLCTASVLAARCT